MLHFLATDVAGGVTGPVKIGMDFGEGVDAKNIDVIITFVLGIFLGCYIYHRISLYKNRKNKDKKE